MLAIETAAWHAVMPDRQIEACGSYPTQKSRPAATSPPETLDGFAKKGTGLSQGARVSAGFPQEIIPLGSRPLPGMLAMHLQDSFVGCTDRELAALNK